MTNAYVTLLYTASYLPGALVLANSLKKTHSTGGKYVVMIPKGDGAFTPSHLRLLSSVFDEIVTVDLLETVNKKDLHLLQVILQRPELMKTLTKLQIFKMGTKFESIVYLDSDILVLQNLDNLFDETSENTILASPDAGWPDIFNSGLFAVKPSVSLYESMLECLGNIDTSSSFDGADQGFLNEFFQEFGEFNTGKERSWRRLPFLYNVTPTGQYQYNPAYIRFAKDIKTVHFIGPEKPWTNKIPPSDLLRDSGAILSLSTLWWETFYSAYGEDTDVKSLLETNEINSFSNFEIPKFDPAENFKELTLEPNGNQPLEVKEDEPAEVEEEPKVEKKKTILDYMFHDDIPERVFGPDPL